MTATLRTPEVANAHASNVFYEIMDFFALQGLIEYTPDAARGGQYVYSPRIGRLAGGVLERANVGTPSGAATARSTTNTVQVGVLVHRQKLTDWYITEPIIAGVGEEQYAADVGNQMAVLGAQALLKDIYYVSIASAQDATLDHNSSVFVDTATAGNQVDFTAAVIQAAKFKMTDHLEGTTIGVCHSKQWQDSRLEEIQNDDFRVPNIVGDLMRGVLFHNVLGTMWIVDDQVPTNYIDGTSAPVNATLYNSLLFRPAGQDPNGLAPLSISFQTPLRMDTQHVLGGQVRRNQLQVYASWNLAVRGSQWDVSTGGANPDATTLGTASNWDDSTDDHEMHGIVRLATN